MRLWSLSVIEFLIFHSSNLHSHSYKRDAGLLYKENNKHFRVTMSFHYAGCLDFQQQDTIIQPLMI